MPRSVRLPDPAPFVWGLALIVPSMLLAVVLAVLRVLDETPPDWLVDEWADLAVAGAALVGVLVLLAGVLKLPRQRDER